MNIKKFASKPTLIKIVIDDEDIKTKYNEPDGITFYTYDTVSLSTYFSFATAQQNLSDRGQSLQAMMTNMILDENGNRVLEEGQDLPFDIAAQAVGKLGELLGKSQKPS
jgi:hypothetical protein